MNKGIFGSWFREFATLVFTQTVQAFILAIVMTIIVSCLSESASGGGSAVNAAGLLAIVALSSFGKIEMLVKNIFGVTSGYGDPAMKNGAGFTAGTLLALRGGKRLLDNHRKSVEGARMIEQGNKGMQVLGAQNLDPTRGLDTGKGNNNSQDNPSDDKDNDTVKNTTDQIKEQVVRLETMGNIQALTEAISRLTEATNTTNKDNAKDKMKEYQDMIRKGEEMQSSARLENAGAVIGGIGGAIVGLAEGDNIAERTLQGAGAGDLVGAGVASRSYGKRRHSQTMQELDEKYNDTMEDYNNKVNKLKSELQGDAATKYRERQRLEVEKYNNDAQIAQLKASLRGGKRGAEELRAAKEKQKDLQAQIDKLTNAGNN